MAFFNNFNIDTIFNEYLLNGLNSNQNWITGMDSNIKIIKDFVNKVVTKSDILAENRNFVNYIDNYNKEYNLVSSLLVKNPNITNFHTPVAIIKYIERIFKKDNIALPEFSKNISPTEYGFLIDLGHLDMI